MRRTTAGILALVTVALAVTSVGVAQAAPTTRACRTVDLAARLVPGSPGAGQRYATVRLTNTSSRTCTIHGAGGVGLLGAPGQGVPTDVQRSGTAATVRLAPRRSAHSLLHWTAVPADDEAGTACEPTAKTLVVTPPGQTTAFLVAWTGGPVCQHGRIDQAPYVAGA